MACGWARRNSLLIPSPRTSCLRRVRGNAARKDDVTRTRLTDTAHRQYTGGSKGCKLFYFKVNFLVSCGFEDFYKTLKLLRYQKNFYWTTLTSNSRFTTAGMALWCLSYLGFLETSVCARLVVQISIAVPLCVLCRSLSCKGGEGWMWIIWIIPLPKRIGCRHGLL